MGNLGISRASHLHAETPVASLQAETILVVEILQLAATLQEVDDRHLLWLQRRREMGVELISLLSCSRRGGIFTSANLNAFAGELYQKQNQ